MKPTTTKTTTVIIDDGDCSKQNHLRPKIIPPNSKLLTAAAATAVAVVDDDDDEIVQRRRKDNNSFTRIRSISDDDIFDQSRPPPLASTTETEAPRIDPTLNSYYRITKNATTTTRSKEANNKSERQRKKCQRLPNILLANFIANLDDGSSNDDDSDQEIQVIKSEPNSNNRAPILADDTPPREFDYGFMKRVKLVQRREEKEKKRLVRKELKKV